MRTCMYTWQTICPCHSRPFNFLSRCTAAGQQTYIGAEQNGGEKAADGNSRRNEWLRLLFPKPFQMLIQLSSRDRQRAVGQTGWTK